MLEKTPSKLPELVCTVCEKYIEVWTSNTADIRSNMALNEREISKLIIRIYSQFQDDKEIKTRCLNLIDSMAEINLYGWHDSIAFYER